MRMHVVCTYMPRLPPIHHLWIVIVVIGVGFHLCPWVGTPASFLLPSAGATTNSSVSIQPRLDYLTYLYSIVEVPRVSSSGGRATTAPPTATQYDDECVIKFHPDPAGQVPVTECRGGSSDLHSRTTPPYGLL